MLFLFLSLSHKGMHFNDCILQPFVGRELFAAGFVSCWAQMNEASQTQLVRSLEMAFSSPNIPPEILATLLNLVCSLLSYKN